LCCFDHAPFERLASLEVLLELFAVKIFIINEKLLRITGQKPSIRSKSLDEISLRASSVSRATA
jgi:hypothetical protein